MLRITYTRVQISQLKARIFVYFSDMDRHVYTCYNGLAGEGKKRTDAQSLQGLSQRSTNAKAGRAKVIEAAKAIGLASLTAKTV